MVEDARIERLERELARALAEVERLSAIEAIRACIYRICRGTDRLDEALVRSGYHPGAQMHYGRMFDGAVEDSIASGLAHQRTQAQRHHMVGNILIRVDGDEAVAESYEIDRHKSVVNGEERDLVLAARVLDRFARRDGEWKIVDRTKVMDWGRAITADDGLYVNSPLPRGADDGSDPSYALLS